MTPLARARFGPLTAYDLRVAGRALALAILAFVVAWLVTAATDEGNVAWGVRAGRTLPIAPACAALGTLVSLVPARARGEVRALEALGRAPWQTPIGAVTGGITAALAAAIAMAAVHAVDVSGFFPVAASGGAYGCVDGGFVDAASGLRIEADGALVRGLAETNAGSSAAPLPDHGRAAAALATCLSGVALPLLVARLLLAWPLPESGRTTRLERRRLWAAAGWTVASAVAGIVLFHAAAARRIPALVAVFPTAMLLAGAVAYYGGLTWRRSE